jgi:hypothetical protein
VETLVEHDLLKGLATPILDPARDLVAGAGLPDPLRSALTVLVEASGLVALAAAFAMLGALSQRQSARSMERAVAGASGLVAAALGIWLLRHPSDRFDDLFGRWDHLAFAGTAGFAITLLAGAQRKWWLAAVSAAILLRYVGAIPVATAVALTATGVLLLRTPLREHRGATVAVQAALVVAAYGFAFWLRSWQFVEASRVQGLLAFWVLRHISLLVTAVRNGPPPLADCGAFVMFYPGVAGMLGAPEVYDEFARRNLTRPPAVQHRRAARRLIEGVLLVVASRLVPMTLERIEASATVPEAWACSIVFFVRTALAIMGLWRSVSGIALLYGVQLRANFAGLLSARNPTELWWSWRGTMTNWLVQHVYAPLGANRHHQSLNIAAAFTVSFLWHALGVPFLSPDFHLAQIVAVALWASANGAAVIAHVNANRTGLIRAPAVVPAGMRNAIAIVLTWTLGSLTPTLMNYQGPAAEGLPRLLRALTGLG